MPQEWDEKGNPIKAAMEWDEKGNPISAKPTEAQQVQQGLPGIPRPQVNMQPSPLGGAHPTAQQEAGINAALPQVPGIVSGIRKAALSAGGASLSGLIPGTGLIAAVTRAGVSGAGAAAGTAAGSAISGQVPNPQEMARTGAAFAGGGLAGEAIAPTINKLASSKTLAQEMFDQASAKAGNQPVNISPRTNEIVDKIVTDAKSGGKLPKVVGDLLDRLGPSTRQPADAIPGPLTYDEARGFYKNITSLSAEEAQQFKGYGKYLLQRLASSFGQDIQQAATAGGAGPEHAIGMQQYALASARNRALEKAGKYAAATAGAAALGGAGYAGVKIAKDILLGK